ncbi:hypothetical protein [Microbulbifer sp. PSTR4-B]|jgi:hypothetical protein|uniref:hypothetical protein n=1 Tax=Microbulbifer sp. PSTR4-B TaxID=3243396 RepID=UPI00403960EB
MAKIEMDEKYQVQLLKESSLFDADWYKSQHLDVDRIKLSPEQHYLRYGWRMGRSPSSFFCSASYLENYPDVLRSGVNPLVHYLRFGRREGRKIQPVRQSNGDKKVDIGVDVAKNSLCQAHEVEEKFYGAEISQLNETQRLLEIYIRRYHELEYQIMDAKV